jgi:glycosyltransferase involved in cell wall biosynthesis
MGYPSGVLISKLLYNRNIPFFIQCVGVDIQRDASLNYGFRLNNKVNHLFCEWVPRANLHLAISDAVINEYINIGISKKNCFILPRGVDTLRFKLVASKKGKLKQKYGFNNKFIFLSAGRYHLKKNFQGTVSAFANLPSWIKDNSLLVLYGKGISDSLEIPVSLGKVKWLKIIEPKFDFGSDFPPQEIVEYMCASDAFVLPSFIETFGIVLIEAMAAGLPIITSNAPGCNFVTDKGKYGLLVDPENIQSITNCLQVIYKDHNLRKTLSNLSLNRANEFDWNLITESLSNLITSHIKMNELD